MGCLGLACKCVRALSLPLRHRPCSSLASLSTARCIIDQFFYLFFLYTFEDVALLLHVLAGLLSAAVATTAQATAAGSEFAAPALPPKGYTSTKQAGWVQRDGK